jgi:hypothetical protein
VRLSVNRSFVSSRLGISSLSSVHYATDKVVLTKAGGGGLAAGGAPHLGSDGSRLRDDGFGRLA